MLNDINSTSDWMRALANAMNNNDADALCDLENITNDWLQSDDEREAQLSLIFAAQAVVEEISYLSDDTDED